MPLKNNKKKRKIILITGSRGELSYFHPIIGEIKRRPNLDYSMIVTNAHPLDIFGSTINEIKKDKFKIDEIIYNTLDGYNHITMAKSLGIFMLHLPELFKRIKPDIILVAGDRGEQLMAAIVGAHMYIPVAHIQSGEISGNIDGVTRHAITRFAHIHFAAYKEAANRIIRTGEEKSRVHLVGAPQLDGFISGRVTSRKEIFNKYRLKEGQPNFLFVFHSVTEEYEQTAKNVDNIMSVIKEFGYPTIIITNNSDAGSAIVRRKIREHQQSFMHLLDNVTNADYAGFLSVVDVIIGNSSSGIIEAPVFKLPAVNIGNRQAGRMRAINVIDVGYDKDEIKKAINLALSKTFKKKMEKCTSPYGDGHSAKRIVDILEKIEINDNLLVKKLTY